MYPPLILIPRKTKKELIFNDYIFPSDTFITLILSHNHFKDQIWEQPKKFDPMRFSRNRKEDKKCPHAYAPFGTGAHHCLEFSFAEMQIKLIMSQLLLHFQWSVPKNYKVDYATIPIQEPKDGLPIDIKHLEMEYSF